MKIQRVIKLSFFLIKSKAAIYIHVESPSREMNLRAMQGLMAPYNQGGLEVEFLQSKMFDMNKFNSVTARAWRPSSALRQVLAFIHF